MALAHALTRMNGRDTHERGQVASSLELLFDLAFVVAISIAGNNFAEAVAQNHVAQGLEMFAFAILWAWINFT